MKITTRKVSCQNRGFLSFPTPLMSVNLLLMKKIFTSLAKSVLVPLELTAAASGTDRAIEKKNFGSGMTTSIIPNKEMEDIMKIVKSLEESGLLTKGVTGAIKKEAKKTKTWISRKFFRYIVSIINSKCENKDEKIFKEEELIEILESLGLIKSI